MRRRLDRRDRPAVRGTPGDAQWARLPRRAGLDPDLSRVSGAAVPTAYNVPGEDAVPLFVQADFGLDAQLRPQLVEIQGFPDRKSTRLNSSHLGISYAVFCLKKKKYADQTRKAHVRNPVTYAPRTSSTAL